MKLKIFVGNFYFDYYYYYYYHRINKTINIEISEIIIIKSIFIVKSDVYTCASYIRIHYREIT